MSCRKYKAYELGEIEEKDFLQHLETCASCRQKQDQDNRLLEAARSLSEPVDAPGLWDRIESALAKEHSLTKSQTSPRPRQKSYRKSYKKSYKKSYIAAAAAILIAVSIGIYIGVFLERNGSGLLSESSLNRVEQTEKQYMAAIAQLEAKAETRMQQMDIQLMLLYKDRLAVIDNQISKCREALEQNPANSHIRKYMLAALQDKKQTLAKLLLPNSSRETGSR